MTVLLGATLADNRGNVVGKGRGDNSCFCVRSSCNSYKIVYMTLLIIHTMTINPEYIVYDSRGSRTT